MHARSRPRRLVPALVAAVVLATAFASVAHTHGALRSDGAGARAQASPDADGVGETLGCAICAAGLRLSHGAPTVPASVAAASLRRGPEADRDETPPCVAACGVVLARAPPLGR